MDTKVTFEEMNGQDTQDMYEIAEHVVGRESSAWERWWVRAMRDPLTLKASLSAALLSLGAPPHACFLTQDLTDIVLSCAPPRYRNGGRDFMRFKNECDIQWRRQNQYNKALNAFAHKHGLVYTHKTQDPAQFRKLFAAFLDLHACKVKERARECQQRGR